LGVATTAYVPRAGVIGVAGPSSIPQSARPGLSARAQEVAAMVATGATNVEIARELGLGVETVKSHVRCILRKLGACNRAEIAVRVAAAERRRQPGSGCRAEDDPCVQLS
jgi:DNA-binding NarL/FixJ family response regulator